MSLGGRSGGGIPPYGYGKLILKPPVSGGITKKEIFKCFTDDQLKDAGFRRTIAVIGAIGGATAFAWRGWPAGFGFLIGAAAAWLNFRWLKDFVAGLGPGGKAGRFAVFFAFRYLVLAAFAYVILRYSKLSLGAVFTGLFAPLAAVVVEVLIQFRYERRNLDH